MRGVWPIVLAILCPAVSGACGVAEETHGGYGAPRATGRVRSALLREVSGITASSRAGIYWVHNDSGGAARLYAVAGSGALVATIEVRGAVARDWEDLAAGAGPEPGQRYLYIADTGDNRLVRDDVDLWRIPEPDLPRGVAETVIESRPAGPKRAAPGPVITPKREEESER